MSPFDILSPTADIYVIPFNEIPLTYAQQCEVDGFHEATGNRWTLEIVKADSTPIWMISSGEMAILDLALSAALRKAREIEKGR